MTLATRTILILALTLAFTAGVTAQETTTTTTTEQTATTPASTGTTTAAPATPTSEQETMSPSSVREHFLQLVDRHPEQLGDVIAMDPTLLNNEPFLTRYPDVADFIAQHPEIRRNPHYFVRQWQRREPARPRSAFEEAVEMMSIVFVFALIAAALTWLVRTIIEQKRWNRLSARQSEVHNKILDRFNSSEELLAYIRTPAGTKFLESAPIALEGEPVRKPNAPLSRALWSIQLGVVSAAAGLGMLLVSLRFDGDSAHGFFAMGVIAFCIGGGFIASAAVSMVIGRRLGVWTERDVPPANVADEPGLMR